MRLFVCIVKATIKYANSLYPAANISASSRACHVITKAREVSAWTASLFSQQINYARKQSTLLTTYPGS